MKRQLNKEELNAICGGAGITIASVLAVMAIGFSFVVIYRFFISSKGSMTLPGGYVFNWGK